MKIDWDKRFLNLAEHFSSWSKDRSTKVGCVIIGSQKEIVSTGYNGFPRGIDDDVEERHDRPMKYLWTEHAEHPGTSVVALPPTLRDRIAALTGAMNVDLDAEIDGDVDL